MLAARMMDLFAANYMDSVPTMQDDEGFLDDASLGDALLHVLSTGRDDEGGKCFDTTAPCSDSDLEKQCTDCELFLDDLETTISDYIDATLDLTIGAKWDESSFDAWETILDASVHGSTSEHPKEPGTIHRDVIWDPIHCIQWTEPYQHCSLRTTSGK
jgi:hypothetical protein